MSKFFYYRSRSLTFDSIERQLNVITNLHLRLMEFSNFQNQINQSTIKLILLNFHQCTMNFNWKYFEILLSKSSIFSIESRIFPIISEQSETINYFKIISQQQIETENQRYETCKRWKLEITKCEHEANAFSYFHRKMSNKIL